MAFKIGSNTVLDKVTSEQNQVLENIPKYAVGYADRVRVNNRIRFSSMRANPSNQGGVGIWGGVVVGGLTYGSPDGKLPADTSNITGQIVRFPFATAVKGSVPITSLNAFRLDGTGITTTTTTGWSSQSGFGILRRGASAVISSAPPYPAAYTTSTHIIPFANFVDTASVGDMGIIRERGTGQSGGNGAQSLDFGYKLFNQQYSAASVYNIDIFPFSKVGFKIATVGSHSTAYSDYAVSNSTDATFTIGGRVEPFTPPVPTPNYNGNVLKIPFASLLTSSTISNVGTKQNYCGTMSTTHGYGLGGRGIPSAPGPTAITTPAPGNIYKFPFSTPEVSATITGGLVAKAFGGTGHSSPTDGWMAGGWGPIYAVSPYPANIRTNIQRVPFASDTLGIDVGDLIVVSPTLVPGTGPYTAPVSGASFSS